MKDYYIKAEEDYLTEVSQACESAWSLSTDMMSIDDLDGVTLLLDHAFKLINENDPIQDRVADRLGRDIDRLQDR